MKASADDWTCHQVSLPQTQISKIKIGYNTGGNLLGGLKFYTKDGAVVLKTEWDWVGKSDFKTHTVLLQDGERVIGYKSRVTLYPGAYHAYHYDF